MALPLLGLAGRQAIRKALLSLGKAGFRMDALGNLSRKGDMQKPLRQDVPQPHLSLDIQKGKKFEDLDRFFLTPKRALDIVGPSLIASTRRRFLRQRTGGIKWVARNVPNIAGIMMDLNKGVSIPGRRNRPRPALVDTGALRDSIQFKTTGGTSAALFATVPYAKIHQDGGTTKIKVTQNMRKNLKRKRQSFKEKFGWLFTKDEVSFQIPKREFLRITRKDIKQIQKAITLVADGIERRNIQNLGTGEN